ncbi:hypothetical protein C922_02846 [Plasmodium inui San Antonio 1]|uniref:Uncharacterized protein n=1 Tax=Plasmodium inui San Antonio 1 TaxID=1237626 RepID=W7ANG2_9APIC|nr:hypothetical protein C922_02846 [Plasmodium inui San Antonio 1]EUD66861.1 hypothetical protein C922_02846 [Plasmodium inui San Antonio 1]
MTTRRQRDPSPQLYASTISDAINRYSLIRTGEHHSGSFELDRNGSDEKDVASQSDLTFLQDDTSDEEGELQTYTSIVPGGTNESIRRRATKREFSPYGWRGKIKGSPKEISMDVLLNKKAEHEAEWTKRIFNILLTAEEEKKSKDYQDVVRTIEREEIKELLLYHSKVVLSEIRKIYRVLGGLVNGGDWVGCKRPLDVSPREEEPLHKLRSKKGGPNLRVKKWYLLNRYYRRLCRIYEEENSLLRRLCMGSPVGDASEVEAGSKGHDKRTTQNILRKCGITYEAKIGTTLPVQIKSKWRWIRGELRRGRKPRLNKRRDTRIFRFVPHVERVEKQLDGESLADERSAPNGRTQNSQVEAPKISTSKCNVYETEAEVRSSNEMAVPNGATVNDCHDDAAMEVGLKEEEEECTQGFTQEEEKSSRQNGALIGGETSGTGVKASSGGATRIDVTVNEQSEQTGEAPVEEHPGKGLNDELEKRDNHLSAENSKLEQMHRSHLVESNMDKKTKLKKKKKVAERTEKGEKKKKKKKNLNVQQTNVVTEKEEEIAGDHSLADILDKATEKTNEGVILCQEVYHDCTH